MKIAQRVKRVDSEKKIRGENNFLEDLKFDNLNYARTLRSDISRGIIKEIKYPSLPKGYYIVDKEDVKVNEVKMIDCDMPVFADKEVNYIGEPIALIVGKNKEVILEILENTEVIYKELPSIYSIEESKANNIQITNKINNEFVSHEFSTGDISNLKNCKTFQGEYKTTYQEQLYMEKQGVVGDFKDDELIVYGSIQCPYYVKNALIHSTCYEEDKIRVIQSDTGGAFGGKEEYPSLIACQIAAAALKVKKPVRLIFDRREDIMFTTKRHPSKVYIKSYINDENKVLGIDIRVELDGGPYIGLSDVVLQRALFTLTGAYKIDNVNVVGKVYATNNIFTGAFRGFGAPQSMFAIEEHFNQVARKLNINPFDFKKKHFVKQGDKTSTNGVYVEEIKLNELANKLEILSDYKKKLNIKDKSDSYYGIGVSFIPHGGGFTGDGEATHIKAKVKLRKNKDDSIDILIANVEMGQGAKTALSKIVASVLDIDIKKVNYKNPDTKFVPDSGPTVASRTTMVVGQLLYKAALKVKERFNEEEFIVEENFKAPDYLVWNQDKLEGNAYMSYSWSGVVAEVEVDKITYDITVKNLYGVYDIGNPIDIKLVEGQIHGGMIQGMGLGMMEKMTSKNGKIEQNNFESYSIPTSKDIPKMEFDLVINKYEYGPFGAKGLGELSLVGVPPAICSAIENAINKDIFNIPVTPEYILEVKEYDKKNKI